MQQVASERAHGPTMRPLLHRWLVEHNPLYLLSAALVLGGLTLLETAAARSEETWAFLGVAAIAELYAIALIGGAAILVRRGQRRPAAMLGLLAVIYQGDVTLHVETCAYMGAVGKLAALLWLIIFVGKLYALAWALELRLSRSAILVPTLGAVGLAVLPHVLRVIDGGDARAALVSLWLFAIAAAVLFTRRDVGSAAGWDVRARRCVRATWAIWGGLALVHAAYWAFTYGFAPWMIVAAVPLLATRWATREWTVWARVVAVEGLAAIAAPSALWVIAAMGAAVMCLTAWLVHLGRVERVASKLPAPPYRSFQPLHASGLVPLFRVDRGAKLRLLVGAAASAWLAAWTAGWSGGALPEHALWLDIALVATCVAPALIARRPYLAWPLVPLVAHLAWQAGWVRTSLDWGVLLVTAGFVGLVGSVIATARRSDVSCDSSR